MKRIRLITETGCRNGSAIGKLASLSAAARRSLAIILIATATLSPSVYGEVVASEGTVNFFVTANSDFDQWTRDPTARDWAWMRANYHRIQAYSPYFDERLKWYPNAWAYKDAYAIKPRWKIFEDHPDWVLRDSSNALLYIPYACSAGTCPQYAADFGNPEFRAWWIAGARDLINRGYIGIRVDDVNMTWRVGDGNGDDVIPVDPRTGNPMTLEDYRRYFAEFMEELRSTLPDVEIVHNVIWYAGSTDDPYIRRQIDAADYLNFQRGISDSGIERGYGKYGFESFLNLVDFIHARGSNIILDDDDSRQTEQTRDYELAFYFLINDGKDMIGADGDRSRMTPHNLWSGYKIDLGKAIGPRYMANGVFRRDFQFGTVLVNQPDMRARRVELGGDYKNKNGQTVNAVYLKAASGAILTKCQAMD